MMVVLGWDEAWEITTQTISYTNHTTLSEALEKWPIRIFQPLLPRIYMIVDEINERFCQNCGSNIQVIGNELKRWRSLPMIK